MLVLQRKELEVITIGDEIEIQVVKIRGNSVRIGVTAPEHLSIKRGEIPMNPPAVPNRLELKYGDLIQRLDRFYRDQHGMQV